MTVTKGRSYICDVNDTSFSAVSKRVYNTEKYGQALLQFNKDMRVTPENPHLLPGQLIQIPSVEYLEKNYSSAIDDSTAVHSQPAKPLSSPWTFHLEIVDGKNVITAKIGQTVQIRVLCNKVDIQSPGGSIQAQGNVLVNGPDLKATSERLTIQLQDEFIVLEGKAQIEYQSEKQVMELRSDRFSVRLNDRGDFERRPPHFEGPPPSIKDAPKDHKEARDPNPPRSSFEEANSSFPATTPLNTFGSPPSSSPLPSTKYDPATNPANMPPQIIDRLSPSGSIAPPFPDGPPPLPRDNRAPGNKE